MSIIIRYKEWLITAPKDAYWVYDLCDEMPEWDSVEQDYVFRKKPKRIDSRKAKDIIQKEGLVCVCDNEDGRIYA